MFIVFNIYELKFNCILTFQFKIYPAVILTALSTVDAAVQISLALRFGFEFRLSLEDRRSCVQVPILEMFFPYPKMLRQSS